MRESEKALESKVEPRETASLQESKAVVLFFNIRRQIQKGEVL
jgi:hypothetical protein